MMRLAFRGEPFHGWQRQPGAISVQQVVEEALATILRRPAPVAVTGPLFPSSSADVRNPRRGTFVQLPSVPQPSHPLCL